jgi:hypothetical protein
MLKEKEEARPHYPVLHKCIFGFKMPTQHPKRRG